MSRWTADFLSSHIFFLPSLEEAHFKHQVLLIPFNLSFFFSLCSFLSFCFDHIVLLPLPFFLSLSRFLYTSFDSLSHVHGHASHPDDVSCLFGLGPDNNDTHTSALAHKQSRVGLSPCCENKPPHNRRRFVDRTRGVGGFCPFETLSLLREHESAQNVRKSLPVAFLATATK